RDLLTDFMARSREDLVKQFTSADGQNPLAEFKNRIGDVVRLASDRQTETLRDMEKRMTELQVELQALRGEREKEEELDEEREGGFAVLVVPGDDKLPAKTRALREYNGDKLLVAWDPEGDGLALEVAYSLARARVLMTRSDADGIDAGALRDTVERALGAMD